MKKRTKFRLRNDLAVPFWISIFVCLLCAAVNFLLFYQSFFRALEKFNEAPIATITFKYKTAQRKFLDRVVWDRLRQNSPVYNGDTIHTANLSEATVWFDDGTVLDLAENTMAQVFRHTDGSLGAELEKGIATVDSSENGAGLTLTASNVKVNVKAGTKISAQKTEESENINLTVQKGTASLADGSTFTEGKKFLVNESGETEAMLSVTSPLPDQKILYFDDESYPVNFEWNGKDKENLTLKIASDKDFRSVTEEFDVSGLNKTTVNLKKGTYYWLLSSEKDEKAKSSGKLQVIQALKPNLLAPATDYSYHYRKKTPSIRFIWTESDTASAYNFVISKSPDMKNPVIEQRSSSSSMIISTLPEGTYWWQVTPYYMINRTGLANPSEVGTFTINRQGELKPPVLYAPGNGEFVNKSKNSLTLSWGMENEASSYKVTVSAMKSLNFPTFTRETAENFITFKGSDVSSLKDGEYFWAVTQIDSEGNESATSEIRSFYAINGKIEQRTIFPPDGYSIWQPLTGDTRFTWKTNLTFTQHIQIAKDSNFSNIIFDSETNNTSFSGAQLEEGTYWWRISTQEGNFKNSTPGKQIHIVPELPQPHQIKPSESYKAVVRPAEEYEFTWDEAENADYYRLKLFKGQSDTPILDENFITATNFSVAMDDFEEGSYRWELQSYSYETDMASRRSSKLASAYFVLRKIRPVVLVSPSNSASISGWDAIENPPYFKWQSAEKFSKASIVITKTGDKNAEPIVLRQTGYSCRLPQLSSGTYEWTVNAYTMDELDISAVKPSYFTIEPIPPFDMPQNAKTEGGSIFNAEYLRNNHEIDFSWNKVSRAQCYIFELYTEKNKRLVREVLNGNENTKFVLKDLTILDKGSFIWKVRAVRMTDDKKRVLIDGIPAENRFTIDYTLNSTGASRKRNGDFYAQ